MKIIALFMTVLLCVGAYAQTDTTVKQQPDGSYTSTTANPDGSYTYGTATRQPGGRYSTTTSSGDGNYTYGTVIVQPRTAPVQRLPATPPPPKPLVYKH